MEFSKRSYILIVAFLSVFHPLEGSDKLSEGNYEAFGNCAFHEEKAFEKEPLEKLPSERKLKLLQEQLEESQKSLAEAKKEKTNLGQYIEELKKQLAEGKEREGELIRQIVAMEGKRLTKIRPTIPLVAQGHKKSYLMFLKGALVYRPQNGSDFGRVDLPIAELGNSLESMFDLSRCGDAGQYLSISTGYRKGKKVENANKLEIWFAPWFLIKEELNTTASHFSIIYDRGNPEAVGIFWNWGGWSDMKFCDYLITQSMDESSHGNLYEKWCAAVKKDPLTTCCACRESINKLSCFSFELQS